MASGPLVPDGLAAEKFEILCAVFQRARAQRHALEGDDLETFLAIRDERDELLGQLQQPGGRDAGAARQRGGVPERTERADAS